MSIEISIGFDEIMLRKIREIPLLFRLGASERILKAMAKPIVTKAKEIAPNSRTSGTRAKMSKKTNAKWPESGRNHIGFVYRKNERGGYLMIGAKDPYANSFNFDSSDDGRPVMYWGRSSGRTKRVDPKERFMMRAYLSSMSQILIEGKAQLEREVKELKIG